MSTLLTLIILAVLPNPSIDDRKGEWIMLYNQSDQAVLLQEYSLATDDNKPKPLFNDNYSLPAKSTVIVARDKAEVEAYFPGQTVLNGQFSLPNRPVKLGIYSTVTAATISTFSYENTASDEVTAQIIICDKYKNIPMSDFDSGLPLSKACEEPKPNHATINNQVPSKQLISATQKSKEIVALYKQLNNSYSFPKLQYAETTMGNASQLEKSGPKYKPIPIKTLSMGEIVKLAILSCGILLMLSEIQPLVLCLPTVPKMANLLKKWRRLIKIRQPVFE